MTGLFLTVSSMWLDGQFYSALNTLHALTVILGLMYIPFGKLFHIFQRPGQPRRRLLQAGQRRGPGGGLPALRRGVRQRPAGRRPQGRAAPGRLRLRDRRRGNYQDTCPRCRRAQVTLAQSARVGGFG